MNDVPAVELNEATKIFPGGLRAVDCVSLRVGVGRAVAVLGPPG